MSKYTKIAIREARWITEHLEPGARWAAGGMSIARETELLRMGIFVRTDDPTVYVIARVDLPDMA